MLTCSGHSAAPNFCVTFAVPICQFFQLLQPSNCMYCPLPKKCWQMYPGIFFWHLQHYSWLQLNDIFDNIDWWVQNLFNNNQISQNGGTTDYCFFTFFSWSFSLSYKTRASHFSFFLFQEFRETLIIARARVIKLSIKVSHSCSKRPSEMFFDRKVVDWDILLYHNCCIIQLKCHSKVVCEAGNKFKCFYESSNYFCFDTNSKIISKSQVRVTSNTSTRMGHHGYWTLGHSP